MNRMRRRVSNVEQEPLATTESQDWRGAPGFRHFDIERDAFVIRYRRDRCGSHARSLCRIGMVAVPSGGQRVPLGAPKINLSPRYSSTNPAPCE